MSEKVYREIARFPSSSAAGRVYVVKQDQDGNLSCDCPAWRFKKPNQERSCKHTEAVAAGKTPPAVPRQVGAAVEVKPTDGVVSGLMADIEKARADKRREGGQMADDPREETGRAAKKGGE